MNYICTWFCADEEGEESYFPQTGRKSSGKAHQDIYWRCIVVFFISSRKFNKDQKHLLFTNLSELPSVDGKSISQILTDLQVEVIKTPFEYKTPKGYYRLFQNQFYEFSILKYIAQTNSNQQDQYMILDSDCVFIKNCTHLFNECKKQGSISFAVDIPIDRLMLDLNRQDLKELYEDFLNMKIEEYPNYHIGEFFLSNVEYIKKFISDFQELWPKLLHKNAMGLKKFNEEAHTLSFLYYKNGLRPGKTDSEIKRMWTDPVHYRNIEVSDLDLTIWHLPGEKLYGFKLLFDYFMKDNNYMGSRIEPPEFVNLMKTTFNIPYLSKSKLGYYYWRNYLKGFKNLLRNFSLDNLSKVSMRFTLLRKS